MMSSTSSSSSEDSDVEYIEDIYPDMPRPRLLKDKNNPFEVLDDLEFKIRYRFRKESAAKIINLINPYMKRAKLRNRSVSVTNQVLITLKFFGSGVLQHDIGDHTSISPLAVSRIIKYVTRAIEKLRYKVIKMPETTNQINKVINDFRQIQNFPRVIGVINCTHIRIQSPGADYADLYRNQKGWFSYNVQCICDANLKFINHISKWPGSVRASTIFYNSSLRRDFEIGVYPNCYILGDDGYTCKPYLLTPLLNPVTSAENNYNQAHKHTMKSIEQACKIWKRRFPCLSVGMQLKRLTLLNVITATAILHNIAIELKDDLLEGANNETGEALDCVALDNNVITNNTRVRNELIENLFSS